MQNLWPPTFTKKSFERRSSISLEDKSLKDLPRSPKTLERLRIFPPNMLLLGSLGTKQKSGMSKQKVT